MLKISPYFPNKYDQCSLTVSLKRKIIWNIAKELDYSLIIDMQIQSKEMTSFMSFSFKFLSDMYHK